MHFCILLIVVVGQIANNYNGVSYEWVMSVLLPITIILIIIFIVERNNQTLAVVQLQNNVNIVPLVDKGPSIKLSNICCQPLIRVKDGVFKLTPGMCNNLTIYINKFNIIEYTDMTGFTVEEFKPVFEYMERYDGKTTPTIEKRTQLNWVDGITQDDAYYMKQFNLTQCMQMVQISDRLGLNGLTNLCAYSISHVIRILSVEQIRRVFGFATGYCDTEELDEMETGTFLDIGG
jgi:hypothetical protein